MHFFRFFRVYVMAIFLLGTHADASETMRTSGVPPMSKAALKELHSNRLAGKNKAFIRTTCAVIDLYVEFHGGCRWISTWEHNVGSKLGRGIGFVKDEQTSPSALNFAFATDPVERLGLSTYQLTRRRLFGQCHYVVYVSAGETFHYAYLGQNKDDYDRCITRSVIEFFLHDGHMDFGSNSYEMELAALHMLLSESDVFEAELVDAISVADEVASWRR
jgi:hypothetical protein